MKRLTILFIALAISIIGCSSQKVSFTKYNPADFPPLEIRYHDYWSAMYCGVPRYADSLAADDERKIFATGLKEITNGKLDKAENIYRSLLASKNDTIKNNSRTILLSLYYNNNKWDDFYKLGKAEGESDSSARARLLFSAYSGSKPESVQFSSNVDTLDIKIRKGSIYVPVTVNGKKFEFLFDTGCDFSCLSESTAKECGIEPISLIRNSLASSTGNAVDSKPGIMGDFQIGSMKIENHPSFLVADDAMRFKFWFYTFASFDGIIGWNAIKNMDVEIDMKNEKMILRKPRAIADPKRNLFWLGFPIIKTQSEEGYELLFGFDAGANKSHVSDIFLQKANPENVEEDTQTYYGIGGKTTDKVKVIPAITLKLAGYDLQFKKLNSGRNMGEFLLLDGVFGLNVCQGGKFRIDALNGVFQMEKNEE